MRGNTHLKKIQKILFEEYKRNGYLDMWNNINNKSIADIAELGLIVTEVSEAIEVIRTSKDENLISHIKEYDDSDKLRYQLGYECADIIIRVLNFMSRKQLSAFFFIRKKNEKNLKRGYLHGKRV